MGLEFHIVRYCCVLVLQSCCKVILKQKYFHVQTYISLLTKWFFFIIEERWSGETMPARTGVWAAERAGRRRSMGDTRDQRGTIETFLKNLIFPRDAIFILYFPNLPWKNNTNSVLNLFQSVFFIELLYYCPDVEKIGVLKVHEGHLIWEQITERWKYPNIFWFWFNYLNHVWI